MNPFQAIFLGIIQGLTEFFPISSSGHLMIFQHILGFNEPEVLFDVSLHIGTLFAVIIFFWKEIYGMIKSLSRISYNSKQIFDDPDLKLAFLIIIATIPTGFIGLAFHKIVDKLFSSIFIVGIMMLLTASFLWATQWVKKNDRNIPEFSVLNAFLIGIAQGLSVMPGLSRSGTTMASGLFLGINRELAARFSFLLSIPAILGAEIVNFKDALHSSSHINHIIIIGVIAAFISGYLTLHFAINIVKNGRLHYFAPYCLMMGLIALFFIK